MSIALHAFRGGITLGAGQVIASGCSFLRNVIIARLITPADFGIASLFVVTYSLVEMLSNLATDSLLVQAEEGDDPQFQSTIHLVQSLRGVANALIVFVAAIPLSRLFGVPDASWAFQALALLPLLRGLGHTDVSRMQRELRFGFSVAVDSSSAIIVTLVAVPLAYWLRNYSVMLWILLLQAMITFLGTHLVAQRPYRWTRHGRFLNRIIRFGWPLLVNGLLMYLIFQGDRVVIGGANHLFHTQSYSLAELGVYSVAWALTMAPAMLVGNLSNALFLPMLSRVQDSRERFERRYVACTQCTSMVAALILVLFITAGGPIVVFLYGQRYASAAIFISWMAAMWALRSVRQGPTLAAMALGDTKNAMIANLARTSAFLAVLIVAGTGGSLASIAACGFFGEALALGVCVVRLQKVHGLAVWIFIRPFAISAAGVSIAALLAYRNLVAGFGASVVLALVLVALLCATLLAAFTEFRRTLLSVILQYRSSAVG